MLAVFFIEVAVEPMVSASELFVVLFAQCLPNPAVL